jgi:hypothetical protein
LISREVTLPSIRVRALEKKSVGGGDESSLRLWLVTSRKCPQGSAKVRKMAPTWLLGSWQRAGATSWQEVKGATCFCFVLVGLWFELMASCLQSWPSIA